MKAKYYESTEHKPGELCFLDTMMDGLVPCKLISYVDNANSVLPKGEVLITTSEGSYHKGQYFIFPLRSIIPRCKVRNTRLGYRISNNFIWV